MSKILFNLFLFSILAACHPESLQPIILRLPEGSESSLSYPLTKLKEHRITSYNVCYTKLLRLLIICTWCQLQTMIFLTPAS